VLSLFQKADLILQLATFLLPVVNSDELISPAGYGAIHIAILTLASKLFCDQSWAQEIVPISERERRDHAITAFGNSRNLTKFEHQRRAVVDSLTLRIVLYFQAVTSSKGLQQFRPVVTGSFDENQSKSSRLPTLAQLFAFTRRMTTLLSRRLEDFPIENGAFLENTTSDRQGPTRNEILMTLETVQISLLLILRHLAFYLGSDTTAYNVSRGAVISNLSTDPQRSKAVIGQAFNGISSRLQSLELARDKLGGDPRPHEVIIEQLVRRIQDLIQL